MKPFILTLLLFGASLAQPPQNTPSPLPPRPSEEDPRLPNGKSQHDEIAKADYKKNVDDAAALLQLAQDLKDDLDKESAYVVSLKTIKKTEDIEKLAKNIRTRLKRW
jgi:hypothetical protein